MILSSGRLIQDRLELSMVLAKVMIYSAEREVQAHPVVIGKRFLGHSSSSMLAVEYMAAGVRIMKT